MDQQIYRANKFKFLGSKKFLLCSGIILHYPNPNNTLDIPLSALSIKIVLNALELQPEVQSKMLGKVHFFKYFKNMHIELKFFWNFCENI